MAEQPAGPTFSTALTTGIYVSRCNVLQIVCEMQGQSSTRMDQQKYSKQGDNEYNSQKQIRVHSIRSTRGLLSSRKLRLSELGNNEMLFIIRRQTNRKYKK